MKQWKTIWKNTIFRRLVLTFLLIMLPIYAIGINIYNWGFHAINDDITKSMVAQVAFYVQQLDSEILRIKRLQNDCAIDENLNNLVFISQMMSNYDKSQSALRLRYRLNAIKNSSDYIQDAKVCIPTLDYTISASNGASFYDNKKQDILQAPSVSPLSQIAFWQGDFYLLYYADSTYQNRILFWIEIPLNRSVLVSDMRQFNNFDGSLSMIYCPSQDVALSDGRDGSSPELAATLKEQLDNSASGTYRVKLNQTNYYGCYYSSPYLGLTFARFIPENIVLSPVKSYQVWLWVFVAMSLIIILLFSASIYSFLHKPLNILLNSFEKVEEGNLSIKIEHRHNDEFMYMYRSFNKMVSNLEALVDQVYKQRILMQNAELKQLQAQINPHFLYNSFFILYSIARAGDYDTVMSFLQQLGSYFKYITRSAEDEVRLSMEIEHARIYTNIQALRFSNRITIEFDELPEQLRDIIVPRLIIQPIIENSFKYGLEQKAGEGILKVGFMDGGHSIDILIEDNGNGMNSKERQSLTETFSDTVHGAEVTGIVNIHKRLRLKFGESSGLAISRSGLGGLKVTIHIELPGGHHV